MVFTNRPVNTSAIHPPVPTAYWPPLPSNFSDIPQSALSCWNSYFEWGVTRYFLADEFYKSTTRIVTTYDPPLSGTSTYSWNATRDCSTTTFAGTTLCDRVPRASSHRRNCITVLTTGTQEWTRYQDDITTITPTWTSEFAKPSPTCVVADDLGPLCSRLFDAWSYRTTEMSKTPLPSGARYNSDVINAIPPCTPIHDVPAPTEKAVCRISAAGYSAYYWPTSQSSFCSSTVPTPTINATTKTAVVSGHTLTSPSVYHFLKDVKVETYAGYAYQPGGIGYLAVNIWNTSTIAPLLTVAQLETDILSASRRCIGREMDYCTMYMDPDFQLQDLATVRSSAYTKNCETCLSRDGGVIYQNNYQASLAVPVSEVVRQNGGMFGDCDWMLWEYNENGWRYYTSSSVSAVLATNIPSTAFVPITVTGKAETTKETATPALAVRRGPKPTS
ncbi:hypothetical protein K469DRAFT_612973 [Zopfia rhizophila CBS 207.26]|uniref:Uncharacterized protein n=1 Tax=Zopfia rhizophila CBS 207.26 TaxID=1314779 RepID=A0A6A6D8P5_9PEZI|nr:hypothetical protein K469DRAFT_612973 [Zopfia rhizophila CBS 207.26]